MLAPTNAVLLRVFVGEEDRYHGRSLYEAIVACALESRLAGATVLPAPEGFGRSRYVRTELNIDAGPHSPVVIEIVDLEDRINEFLPQLHNMLESGLVTFEKVHAIRYPRQNAQWRDVPASPTRALGAEHC